MLLFLVINMNHIFAILNPFCFFIFDSYDYIKKFVLMLTDTSLLKNILLIAILRAYILEHIIRHLYLNSLTD